MEQHPHKVVWDLNKDFSKEVKSVLICNYCGGLIQNPTDLDIKCFSCGRKFIDTKTEVQYLNRG
jgi:hypothetical protein